MLAWTEEVCDQHIAVLELKEDEHLRVLIAQHGTKKWSLIASILKTKSSKQCRRRWKNTLDMEAKATTWSPHEDALLIKYHRQLGNKWTAISKKFGDRTDNAVKNRWNALVRRQPELAEEDSPVTTVGVRRGTRTRAAMDSGGSSGSDGAPSGKRRRRAAGAGRSGSGATGTTVSGGGRSIGHATRGGSSAAAQAAAAAQVAAAAANFFPPPWGASGGVSGISTLDGTQWLGVPGMPTPFDAPVGMAPPAVNIVVPRDALTAEEVAVAQQLNAKRTPFTIQIAGSDCGIGDGLMGPDFSGLLSGPLPSLPGFIPLGGSLPSLPMPDWAGVDLRGQLGNSGSTLGSNGAGAAAGGGPGAAYPSLSMNDLLNWLNSTGGGSGEQPFSGSMDLMGARGSGGTATAPGALAPADPDRPLTRRSSQRLTAAPAAAAAAAPGAPAPAGVGRSAFHDSGSLPHSMSGSSGLSSGQRELLARLFSQARESAEVEKQAAAAAAGGGDAKRGRAGSQRGEPMQRVISVGLVRSMSLSMGRVGSLGVGSLNGTRSTRSDPMGRTRSSSGRGAASSGFAEAAAAAVAAVDGAAPGGAPAAAPPLGRALTRGKRTLGNAASAGAALPLSGPPSFGLGPAEFPVYAQTLTSDDIDKILDVSSTHASRPRASLTPPPPRPPLQALSKPN